jgi:hypothetical protein
MYACGYEIGRGFFEVVCAPDHLPHISSDPPPTVSQFVNCSVPALQQIEHGSLLYIRAFRFLVPHQPIGLCSYGREISKILTMWHMKHIHVADVSTLAAH